MFLASEMLDLNLSSSRLLERKIRTSGLPENLDGRLRGGGNEERRNAGNIRRFKWYFKR